MRLSPFVASIATLGLIAPLGIATATSSDAAAGCGRPVWDLDHDGHTDAVVAASPSARVVYLDGAGGIDRGEIGLEIPDQVDGGERTAGIGAFASISLADSAADQDFCSLVAVGVPEATVNGVERAGLVHVYRVVPGDDGYQQPGNDQLLFTITQANDGLDQTKPTKNARFGASLAAYDQTSFADGVTPLAIGAPGETVEGVAGAGSVAIVTLSKTGDVTAARRVTRAPGKGVSKSSALGTSLAANRGLVVAGAPGRTISGKVGAGSVLLVPSDPAAPVTEVSQATSVVPGTAEKGDRFGHAVASTWNPTLDRHEIAVGAPGEDVGKIVDGGLVTTMRSTSSGKLSVLKSFTQNSAGVPGTVEKGDQFGFSLAAIPRLGSPSAWLVGVPFEDDGSKVDAGRIQTIGEKKNRDWGNNVVFGGSTITPGFRFGHTVVAPRGDRGPLWRAAGDDASDPFAGVNLPGWGTLARFRADPELQSNRLGPALGG